MNVQCGGHFYFVVEETSVTDEGRPVGLVSRVRITPGKDRGSRR